MEVEYELSREEYVEYVKLAYARMARIGKAHLQMFAINIVIWIFVGMGIMGLFDFYKSYDGIDFSYLNLTLVLWGIAIVGLIAVTVYQRKFYMHHSLNENGRMMKRQTVSLTDEAIGFRTVDSEQTYWWPAIMAKEVSKHLICLYIDNNQALLIPKRVFADEAHLQEWLSYIDNKLSR